MGNIFGRNSQPVVVMDNGNGYPASGSVVITSISGNVYSVQLSAANYGAVTYGVLNL